MGHCELVVTTLFAMAMLGFDAVEAAPRASREVFESRLLPADLRQAHTYVGKRGAHIHQGIQHSVSQVPGSLGRSIDSLSRGRRGGHRHAMVAPKVRGASTLAPAVHGEPKTVVCPKVGYLLSMGTVGEPQGWFVFHIYVHDDVPWSMARDVARRFDWWLREMRELLPRGTGLQLRIVHGEKGLADIGYTSDKNEHPEKGLNALKAAIAKKGACATGLPMPRNYHLLLTAKQPHPGMHGLASQGARVGIASLASLRTAGHELGHMLHATHDGGAVERVHGSLPCATAMRESRGWPRYPDCGRFSSTNRENIRNHLAGLWKAASSKAKA